VNFSATIRQNGEVSIIDLTGQLTSFASGALRNTIADLMRQGRKKIVLNVGELVYLDSSGVAALVNRYMSVIKQAGGNESRGADPKSGRYIEDYAAVSSLSGISE